MARRSSGGMALSAPDAALGRGDMPQPEESEMIDSVDYPAVEFDYSDFWFIVVGISLFIFDLVTDILLAIDFFKKEMPDYGFVATGLTIAPFVVICCLGLSWYIQDLIKERRLKESSDEATIQPYITSSYLWCCRFFFTLIQMGPFFRDAEYSYYGHMSKKRNLTQSQRKMYTKFLRYVNLDRRLLNLFESFFLDAPQLTWQLYIIFVLKQNEDVDITQVQATSLLSAWGNLAFTLLSYNKALRRSNNDKLNMSKISIPFYCFWRAFEIGGRVICIAMFASVFTLWAVVLLIIHWVIMFVWLIFQKTKRFYKNCFIERAFHFICGFVMIFCFLNLKEGQTRFRYLLFYVIVYAENVSMFIVWWLYTPDLADMFHVAGLISVSALFMFHIIIQALYYVVCHPNKKIKCCAPLNFNSICNEIQDQVGDAVDDTNEQDALSEIEETL